MHTHTHTHTHTLTHTQELDTSVEVGRKLRREYNSTRQDAEGMLQVRHSEPKERSLGLQGGTDI